MSHIQIKNTVKRFKDLILDEMEVAGVKCWLAGGCLRDYFSGSYVKTDYDLFFPTQKDYDKALKLFKGTDGWLKWESEKGCKIVRNGKTFDLVKMFFKSPQETIEAFD
jgi:tRNA nucleotidyltransferase/poly(A) polymerase